MMDSCFLESPKPYSETKQRAEGNTDANGYKVTPENEFKQSIEHSTTPTSCTWNACKSEVVANAFKNTLQLKKSELDLSHIEAITTMEIDCIRDFLNAFVYIKTLNMQYCSINIPIVTALSNNFSLTSLNVGWTKMNSKLLSALKLEATLTALNLEHNNITAKGLKILSHYTRLKSLNLEANKVGDKGAIILASHPTLIDLNLVSNLISVAGTKALIANTTLLILNLSYNNISPENTDLGKNSTLTILNLSFCGVKDAGIKSLAYISSLKALSLAVNPISDANAKLLADNLSLMELNIWQSWISATAKQCLDHGFASTRFSKIAFLMGTHERLGARSCLFKYFRSTLFDKNILKQLLEFVSCTTNAIKFPEFKPSDNTILSLLNPISDNIKFQSVFRDSLENKQLNLNEIVFTSNEITNDIIPFLRMHPEVSTLVLHSVFDMESMQTLAENTAIASIKFIRRGLSQYPWFYNKWNNDRMEVLVSYLKISTSIQALDLNYNHIGSEGLVILVKGLKENRSLTSLDLGSNFIGISHTFWGTLFSVEGIDALAEYLAINRTLTSLNISDNFIDSDVTTLAKALKNNTTLTTLNLGHNSINCPSDRNTFYRWSIYTMTRPLQENRTLRHLDLSHNYLHDATSMAAISEMVTKNISLMSINLGNNSEGCLSTDDPRKNWMEEINTFINARNTKRQLTLIVSALEEYDKKLNHEHITSLLFSYMGCKAPAPLSKAKNTMKEVCFSCPTM